MLCLFKTCTISAKQISASISHYFSANPLVMFSHLSWCWNVSVKTTYLQVQLFIFLNVDVTLINIDRTTQLLERKISQHLPSVTSSQFQNNLRKSVVSSRSVIVEHPIKNHVSRHSMFSQSPFEFHLKVFETIFIKSRHTSLCK